MEWAAFYFEDRELGRYSLAGTFPGESQATAELLAHDNGIRAEQITARVIREASARPGSNANNFDYQN